MKKEKYEWIHSWQDENFNTDLPRVLLIGDSITYNYQENVRKILKRICYVDYLATSFSVDTKIYNDLIKDYAGYNKYDLVHYNFGLHGKHLSKTVYKAKVKKIINTLLSKSKVILANSTVIYEKGNNAFDKSWMTRVNERNEAIKELATELNLKTDDLFSLSLSIPQEMRYKDGTHYLAKGYKIFAEQVANIIKENL